MALEGGARGPHPLHAPERLWPETSCYTDLWIELLAALGHPPEASLGFTVAVAYEGDQFTFLKPPPGDLERLFGLRVVELALFDGIEPHVAVQLASGRPVLLEVDAFYLPDTRATTWHRAHAKTTIAITELDRGRRRLGYVHNGGWFEAEGADVDGILRSGPASAVRGELLPPYAELVARGPAPPIGALPGLARDVLGRSVALALRRDPIALWRADLPAQVERLSREPFDWFHRWAFNLPRQLGAAFELLAAHLDWLAGAGHGDLRAAGEPALELAGLARTLQLRLARTARQRRPIDPEPYLDRLAEARALCLDRLGRALGIAP